MTVSDLCFSASGLVINLPRSKADQEQAGDKVAIPFGEHDDTCPIKALRKWLATAGVTYPKIDFENAVAWCEKKTGKTLAPSQREALKTVLTSRVAIITGGPGVGKTTLVNSILLILRAKKVKCLLCAPTGRAAKRLTETTGLEAKTIDGGTCDR